VLKGRNRQQFEHMLERNVRAAVKDTGIHADLTRREGVLILRVPLAGRDAAEHATAVEQVLQRVADVPGIVRVCRAWRVDKTPEATVEAAIDLTRGTTGPFAVRPRRRDKRFPLTSSQLAVLVGREIQKAHGLPVNLSHPETE